MFQLFYLKIILMWLKTEAWLLKQPFKMQYLKLRLWLDPTFIDKCIEIINSSQAKIDELKKEI